MPKLPPEERALIAAIIADPDEDTPRLAYADWLDEHDQPERAEFIRVQVGLARLVIGTQREERYDQLAQRERELITAHWRDWERAFAATLPANRQTHFWFRRGLIGEVTCTPKYFKETAGHLVAAAPFECLSLRRPTARTMQETVNNPRFPRFRELQLDADEITPQVVEPLLNADLAHLRRLSISSNLGYSEPPPAWANRSAEVVERVAACPSLVSLDVLDLRLAGVGERGAEALAMSVALARVRVLLLTGNVFSPVTASSLRKRFGKCVYLDYPDYQGRLTMNDLR